MTHDHEEEPTVAEGQMHLTDLAELAATDRMLDAVAARDGVDDGDEVAALLLALALDVDAGDRWAEASPALDPELEQLLSDWLAADASEVAGTGVAAPAAADDTLVLRRPRGVDRAVGWTPRRLMPHALRVGTAAAVAAFAVTIGGLLTNGSGPLAGIPGLGSGIGQVAGDPADQVETLIQQAKAAVRAGRPREAETLYRKALELVPQLDPAKRPALTQALVDLRTELVTAPGGPSSVPLPPPPVAGGETEPVQTPGQDGSAPSSPTPAPVTPAPTTTVPDPQPTPTTADPATSAPTPSETPSPTETTPSPTETTPEATPTTVDPHTPPTGDSGGGDGGGSGISVGPEATVQDETPAP